MCCHVSVYLCVIKRHVVWDWQTLINELIEWVSQHSSLFSMTACDPGESEEEKADLDRWSDWGLGAGRLLFKEVRLLCPSGSGWKMTFPHTQTHDEEIRQTQQSTALFFFSFFFFLSHISSNMCLILGPICVHPTQIFMRYGRQRWKLRGRIEINGKQVWDSEEMVFLPLITEFLSIKVQSVHTRSMSYLSGTHFTVEISNTLKKAMILWA